MIDGGRSTYSTDQSLNANTSFVRRISTQDAKAWSRFVKVFGPLIFRWCKLSGLQDEVAADVGQDVFRAVIKGIHNFDHRPEDSLVRWLRRITQNKIADHWRAADRTPKSLGGSTFQSVIGALSRAENVDPAEEEDNENKLIMAQLIQSMKSQFSEKAWAAFWETAVNGRTSGDVAEDLKMTSMAVRKAKSRVLCKLRSEMRDVVDLENWKGIFSAMSHVDDKPNG